MSNLFEVLNSWSALWGAAVWRASLGGGIVLLLVGVLSLVWTKMPAVSRSWLWRLAFCKLLLALVWGASIRLPLLPASSPQKAPQARPLVASLPTGQEMVASVEDQSVPVASPVSSTKHIFSSKAVEQETSRRTETWPASAKPQLGTEQITKSTSAVAQRIAPPRVQLTATSLLMLVWSVGVLFGVARAWRMWQQARALREWCAPVGEGRVAEQVAELQARLGLGRAPQLLTGAHIVAPALTGVAKPAILLPAPLIHNTNPDELRLVVAHELAHERRRDLAWNWLLCAGQIVFFFHPLVWWSGREWQRANEMACDSLALSATALH